MPRVPITINLAAADFLAAAPATDDTSIVGSFEIAADAGNSGNITITGTPDSVEIEPGDTKFFDGIRLSDLTIQMTAGDAGTIVGNTL